MKDQYILNIIKKTKKILDNKTIVSTLINFFLLKNSIIYLCRESQKYNQTNYTFLNTLHRCFDSFDIYDLIYSFECVIDDNIKKEKGIVYTPKYIANFITSYSLEHWNGDKIPYICDPCCGSGVFLIECITQLSNKYNISKIEALNYVRGIDVDIQSVSYCKIVIELFLQINGEQCECLENKIVCSDVLLDGHEIIFNKLDICYIDIIVTNPPYVKLQNINDDYKNLLIKKYKQYIHGSFSTAILFLVASYELLKHSNGIMGCITQNNFFTSLSAKKIRNWLCQNNFIHTIIDFRDKIIFKKNSAYTCLLFLDFRGIDNFKFAWSDGKLENLDTSIQFSYIQTHGLQYEKWRLAPSIHLKNIHKIERMPLRLKDIVDIKVGFATLKDSIFLLDEVQAINFEQEILKPAIKISDIDSECDLQTYKKYIIFPYKMINNKYYIIEEKAMKEKYPRTYLYLLSHKEALSSRSSNNKTGIFYEWGRKQGMYSYENKIITKTFNSSPKFIIDNTGALFCNGYALVLKKDFNLLVLKKILNSQVMNYYMKLTSFNIDGGYQCFQKNFIENFGIPKLGKEDIEIILNNNGKKLDCYLMKLYDIDKHIPNDIFI